MPTRPLRRTIAIVRSSLEQFSQLHAALSPQQKRKFRYLAIASAVPIFGAVAAFGVVPNAPDAALLPTHQVAQILPAPALADQIEALGQAEQSFMHEERVRRGDNLSTVLSRLNVDDAVAEQFVRSDARAKALYQLKPGRVVQAKTDEDGALLWLRYIHTPVVGASSNTVAREESADVHALVVERIGDHFDIKDELAVNDRRIELRSGEIRSSLFGATDAAGVPDAIASQIADIFSGDIDFYSDLRRGDQFRVVYESFYQGGEYVKSGRVLAIEFINAGKAHQAVWYQPAGQTGGYYGFDGHSMRRAFLRAPLEFTRISSGFTTARFHPILQLWRAHKGVDYAAPTGTSVRATGDGVVEFAGTQHGYGNIVVIKHQGQFSTAYGHLSAFAGSLRKGDRVAQGQLIGYVGMTGWATGPHLHYEFRVNGEQRDPLSADIPQTVPLSRDQLTTFRQRSLDLNRQIEILRSIQLADRASPRAA